MPKIIDIPTLTKLIHDVGIQPFLLGSIDSLRIAFERWQAFEKTPRHVIHYPHGVTELMPIADDELYACKYVNGHPFNPKDNKLTVVALGLLAEIKNGYPLMLCEMTLLTAIRTAATSALASSYLARKHSHRLAIIGTGSQAEFQVLAHSVIFNITHVSYYDTDPKAMQKFAANLQDQSFAMQAGDNAEQTIQDADIIITATADKQRLKILHKEWIQPGVHINAVGGDCADKTELDTSILHDSKIVVEYMPQTEMEGEIKHLDKKNVHAELWELVQNQKPGRVNDNEVTIFDSVGFAIEDFAILKYVYELAVAKQIGSEVELIPEINDPKNLFGILK